MLLLRSFEEQGHILFKYRGYFPVVLFLLLIPFMAWQEALSIPSEWHPVLTALCVLLSASGIIFRAVTIGQTPDGTSGRNTKAQKAKALNTKGVYSIVRHPLYFGNFLIWAGILCFTLDPGFILISILLFWIVYERIMYAEERFLEREFGKELEEWARGVPAFFPRFSGYVPTGRSFRIKRVLRKEYSGFLATVIGFVYVAFLRDLFQSQEFTWDPRLGAVLLVGVLIGMTFRTLHHGTSLLKERERDPDA